MQKTDVSASADRMWIYEHFFEMGLELKCVCDWTGVLRCVSPSWRRQLGYDPEDLKARPFVDLVYPDDRPAVQSVLSELRQGHSISALENRYRAKDGRIHRFVWSLIPSLEDRLIYATGTSVGERGRREISVGLEPYVRHIRNAPDMCASVNIRTGEINWCNDALVDKTGYDRVEILGRSVLGLYHADSVNDAERAASTFKRGGEVDNAELLLECKDGARLPVLLSGRVLRNSQGIVEHGILTWRDISNLIHVQSRDQLAIELERTNEDLERFAYVASHDLQEPLRMVASYTQLLAERYAGQLDDRADRYIAYAVDGAKRMQGLISDLLALSRVGRSKRNFQHVELDGVCYQVIQAFAGEADAVGAVIKMGRLPAVKGDPSELELIFQNLIGNAIKYRGSEPLSIQVDAESSDGFWDIHIKDNGIGFEEGDAELIFGMFEKLHARTQYPGTGIGLAIVQKIVRLHGGRAWAESAPGQGATFHFTMPKAIEGGLSE